MQTRILTILLMLLPALWLAGCGEDAQTQAGQLPESVTELRKMRDDLQNQLDKINTKLAKLDTTTNERRKLIELAAAQPVRFQHFLNVQGQIESDGDINVSPEASGRIVQLLVREGQQVSKGQVIARLDDSVLRRQLDELKTQLELATTNYERRKRLWEQKVGAEMQYIEAENAKKSVERRIQTAEEQLALYVVRAPQAGEVETVFPKEGEMASPGMPIVRLIGPGRYKLVAQVAESYITKVRKGDKVEVTLPDAGETYMATVTLVGQAINPNSRTFPLEVSVPVGSRNVRPNMVAFVKINDYTSDKAITVPVTIIKGTEGENFIFTATRKGSDWIAKRTPVQVGLTYDNQTEILSGVAVGDQVILKGHQDVQDGQLLELPAQPAAEAPATKAPQANAQPTK